MKNECSYVRDVLPLYFENMVSEDTAAFVEEHLKAELDEGHTQEAAPEGVPDSRDNRRDFHSFLRFAVLFPGLSCP